MIEVKQPTKQTIKEEKTTKESGSCSLCGRHARKLYQNNTCKACLVKCFQQLIPFINHHRKVKHHENGK